MTRVKVCGITRKEDALSAVELGVDALGFVFYSRSPRSVSPEQAARIIREIPPFVVPVGVFVDCAFVQILSIIRSCGLGAIQLHGRESPAFCTRFGVKVIKAFRVKGGRLPAGLARYRTDAILLDGFRKGVPGGTGTAFPWDVAIKAKRYGRIILAGGLTCENVREAIEVVRPYAVDVSTGVEKAPGQKDPYLLEAFVREAKRSSGSVESSESETR